MGTNLYIPHTAQLRAEQVESWACQSGDWGRTGPVRGIETHFSAKGILDAVDEDEKPAILAAWAKGFLAGRNR
jgi:hypothetical protein